MIRALLAEDRVVARGGLRALLGAHADIEAAGDAANGREVLRQTLQLHLDAGHT